MAGILLDRVAVWLRQTYSIYERHEYTPPHLQRPNAWSIRIVHRGSTPDLGGTQLHAEKCQSVYWSIHGYEIHLGDEKR